MGTAGDDPGELPRWRRWALWGAVFLAALLLHIPFFLRPPRTLTRAERALAEIARQALRQGDARFDYGGFFLHAEGAAGGAPERRWRALAARIKEQAEPLGGRQLDVGVGHVLHALFRDAHLGRYRREEARMSGFFAADDEAGGNCEAQTRLLVSSVRASGMKLPDGVDLGVEVFQDHVQAVLVNRRERTLWNILTGEQDATPRSDVYHPAVLLVAYLRGLGLRSPVQEADLRLVRGPKPRLGNRGESFLTTSTLRLPTARVRFAQGPTPERAELPFPLPRRGVEPSRAAGADKEATWRDDFVASNDPLLLFPIDRVDGPFGLVGSTLVFRQREHAERYLATKTDAERKAFLLDLAEEQLRRELGAQPPELGSMERLAALGPQALGAKLGRVRRIEQLVSLTEQAIDRGRGTSNTSMVGAALELRLPDLARVGAGVRAFTEQTGQQPGAFLHRLGALDHGSRRQLLAFFVPRLQSAQVKALSSALSEPARVALVAAETERPAPPTDEAPLLEAELIDIPLPSPAASSPAPAGSAAAPRPGAAPAEQGAETLPVGAYVDAVLSGLFSSGAAAEALPVLRRWDARASEALRSTPQPECSEALLRLQYAVLRPLKDAGQEPPAHLQDAAKKLEKSCSQAPRR